jgi:hypothetical protein
MRVRLINESALPDGPLETLLQHAAVAAHCRGPVVAVVKRGGFHQHGKARRATQVRSSVTGRLVTTHAGYIVVWPMTGWYHAGYDYLKDFEFFFRMLIHEFAHVHDFQKGKAFGQYKRRWANRPHERRAIRAEHRGVKWIGQRQDRQVEVNEAIMALAIAAEEKGKQREAAKQQATREAAQKAEEQKLAGVSAVKFVGRFPKGLRDFILARAEQVHEACNEGGRENNYWIYLRKGWSWEGECHSIHETTAAEVRAAFGYVSRCECAECKAEGEEVSE